MAQQRVEASGPDLLQYTQEGFGSIKSIADKTEKAILERIDSVDRALSAADDGLAKDITHTTQLLENAQQEALRASEKAEKSQAAINVASNEWRNTLNDFKTTLVSRPEFDKLYSEFASYKLEVARVLAASSGEKSGVRETKETSMAQLTLISGAIGIIASVVVAFMFRATAPPVQIAAPVPQAPQVVVVPAAPTTNGAVK